jgi:hypothetical protein
MFQTKFAEETETRILRSIIFSQESCRLRDNVVKYSRAGQTTDNNIIRHMRSESRITKATAIHSEYGILIAFTWQQWLRERATMLRSAYTLSRVTYIHDSALILLNSLTGKILTRYKIKSHDSMRRHAVKMFTSINM